MDNVEIRNRGIYGHAERPVHIDPEEAIAAVGGGIRTAQRRPPRIWRKARARWLIPTLPGGPGCFIAEGISPKVMSKPSGMKIGSKPKPEGSARRPDHRSSGATLIEVVAPVRMGGSVATKALTAQARSIAPIACRRLSSTRCIAIWCSGPVGVGPVGGIGRRSPPSASIAEAGIVGQRQHAGAPPAAACAFDAGSVFDKGRAGFLRFWQAELARRHQHDTERGEQLAEFSWRACLALWVASSSFSPRFRRGRP